jgi:hypothetical protein
MLQALRVLGAIALMVLGTTAAQAQFVSMSGSYHESNGQAVEIPQIGQEIVCGAGGNISAPPSAPGDARCHGSRQTIYDPILGPINGYLKPATGVEQVVTGIVPGGLLKGSTFTVPTGFFGRIPPGALSTNPVEAPVINNAVIWISTAFTAIMPPAGRLISPPASTRVMRKQGNGPIAGQPLRPTGPPAVRNVVMLPPAGSNDTGTVTYTEGPNKFGGTMASLLDGQTLLWIKNAQFDALFPTVYTPVLATQPVGDTAVQLNSRAGMGWDYAVAGAQVAGRIFGLTGTSIVLCNAGILPVSPAGCNVPPATFPQPGAVPLGSIAPATSIKHVFPWTTGTVTNVVHAVRGAPRTFTETITGMGYDTTAMTVGVRNVGLVAGSYTGRISDTGTELAGQMSGINLRFTPEPGATVALFAGIGLLGLAAARRRS